MVGGENQAVASDPERDRTSSPSRRKRLRAIPRPSKSAAGSASASATTGEAEPEAEVPPKATQRGGTKARRHRRLQGYKPHITAPQRHSDLTVEAAYQELLQRTRFRVHSTHALHALLDTVKDPSDLDVAMDALLLCYTANSPLDERGGSTSTKLVNACLRAGVPMQAVDVLDSSSLYRLRPTRKAFARLAGYGGAHSQPEVVHASLRLFREYECKANSKVAHTLIKALADVGERQEALELMLAFDDEGVPLSWGTCSRMVQEVVDETERRQLSEEQMPPELATAAVAVMKLVLRRHTTTALGEESPSAVSIHGRAASAERGVRVLQRTATLAQPQAGICIPA